MTRIWHSMKIIHSPLIDSWSDRARCLAVEISIGKTSIVACVVYGHAKSHPDRHTNEVLCAEVFHWASGLNKPVLVGGDFNESPASSTTLALSESWDFYLLTEQCTTTLGRSGGSAASEPLDHVFGNALLRDCLQSATVEKSFWISDHYPLVCCLSVPDSGFQISRWPRATSLPPSRVADPHWKGSSTSLAEWTRKAETWLSDAYDVPIPSKSLVTSEPFSPPPLPQDRYYLTLKAAQGVASHLLERGLSPNGVASLNRKLFSLKLPNGSLEEILKSLQESLGRHLKAKQALAVKEWKGRVQSWGMDSKALFRFIRNEFPPKTICVDSEEGLISHPPKVAEHLSDYWTKIESWPSVEAEVHAWYCLEDKYGAYIPHSPVTVDVTPSLLQNIVKHTKESCPGLDGWSISELKALPLAAWSDILCLLRQGEGIYHKTLLGLVRRIPVEKGSPSRPAPADIRPIDIFSQIVRCLSAAQMSCLIQWKKSIIHRCQYASHGGTLRPLSRYTLAAERVKMKIGEVWSLSIDFMKLFNCVCPRPSH